MEVLRKIKCGRRGFTLIETLVSLAILSLLALLLASVIGVSTNVAGRNSEIQKSGYEAAAGVESKMSGFMQDTGMTVVTSEISSFTIDFGGMAVEAAGSHIFCSDLDGDVKLRYFIPE